MDRYVPKFILKRIFEDINNGMEINDLIDEYCTDFDSKNMLWLYMMVI